MKRGNNYSGARWTFATRREPAPYKRTYLCDRGHEHRTEEAMHRCENNPGAKTRKGR